MPPLEAFGPSIAIGLILFVMLWFALGTQRNIRKGNDLLRWLQGGLPLLGRRTTMRWLGSSAVQLESVEPAAPFRAFARSRGRRDFVIVRVSLVRAPRYSMEVRDPRGWTARGELDSGDETAAGGDGWQTLPWPDGCVARAGPGADDTAVRSMWDRLTGAGAGVWKLTVQPVVPHLEVHVRPPETGTSGADWLLAPIRDLAASLVER